MPRWSPARDTEELILDIYQACSEPGYWKHCLEGIAELTGSNDCVLQGSRLAKAGERSSFLMLAHLPLHETAGYEPYVREHGDPRLAFSLRRAPVGRTFQDRDFIDSKSMRRHPLYQEYFRRIDFGRMVGVTLMRSEHGDEQIAIGIAPQRSFAQGPLVSSALRAWKYVVPHLVRSTRVAYRLGTLSWDGVANAGKSRLVFVLDAKFRVVHANEAAEMGFIDGSVALNPDASLKLLSPRLDRAIRNAHSDHARKEGQVKAGSVPEGQSMWHWSLTILTEGGRPHESMGSPVRFRLLLNRSRVSSERVLTPAQERVVQQLAAGMHLRQAAEASGMAYETARFHVKQAMARFDLHSQTALVSRYLIERLERNSY